MMKKTPLLAAVLLLASAFGGYRGNKDGPAGGGKGVLGTNDPVTIDYYFPMHPSDKAEQFTDDAPGLERLREKTSVTIKWQLVPGASPQLQIESFNLLMASGNLPDVVCGNPVTMLKLYPDAWIPYDPILRASPDRYPNLTAYILEDPYIMAYLAGSDGHIRIIPEIGARRIGNCFMIRGDLLAAYGLDDPVTLEDWHTALTRAKADGAIPWLTRGQRGGIISLFTGYMDCAAEDYFEENGRIKYGVFDPRFKEVIEIARQWYAEGLIDQEYPSTDTTRWWERLLRGDVFATFDNPARISIANVEFIQNKRPARLKGLLPMRSKRTGKRYTKEHWPKVRDKCAAISVQAEHPERILDMFEYCFSEEGFILMNFGIENYSFSYVDGVPRIDPDYMVKVRDGVIKNPVTTKDMPKVLRDELYYDYATEREDHLAVQEIRDQFAAGDHIQENWIASLSFTGEEREALAPYLAELNTYRSEMLDKFIMGIEPMDKWDAFAAQLEKMGVRKTMEIYQQALDRLLKKEGAL